MDFHIITQVLRDQLGHLLMTVVEQKDLVIDGELTKPFDRFAGISFLKQHGVEKIFKLDPSQKVIHGSERRIYIVRAKMVTMKAIADQINAERNRGDKRLYTIVLVPRKLELCEMILETEGVSGYVTIEELHLDLIPLDTDLMSLELPDFFSSFYIDEDYTWIHTVASSLVNLENFFGVIPDVFCVGKGSKMVYELMDSMRGLSGTPHPADSRSQIGQLILVDRSVDYVTPLCTPMTYEALLDERFKIECGIINFGHEVTGKTQDVKQLLTSQDEVYRVIRDRHFSNVFTYLSSKTKELQTGYDKKKDLKTVGDMKNFVSNDLKDLKAQHRTLTYHIGACEAIMKKKKSEDFEDYIKAEHSVLEGIETKENLTYIEDSLCKQVSSLSPLKLLCLLSLTQGGLVSSIYKSITNQFLQSKGFEHMVDLYQLKRIGLLEEQTATLTPAKPLPKSLPGIAKSSQFRTLAKKLNLIPKSLDDINLRSPNDMSYVFSGAYTPLLCKIVEQILERGGLTGMDEVIKLIPGGIVRHDKTPPNGSKSKSDTVLVYFLGGCTFSEIAALRYLVRQFSRKVVIATTAIMTGDTFLKAVLE
ncbi:vacuolar protein sorting-associated protein 33B-like [Haliotis cracherodii]|uniref:vacuolar protein sorting-associated protein 33B-like n=1 Tax=Haliotis cracherodii TaxID=6455 RepID=UPI0039EC8764